MNEIERQRRLSAAYRYLIELSRKKRMADGGTGLAAPPPPASGEPSAVSQGHINYNPPYRKKQAEAGIDAPRLEVS